MKHSSQPRTSPSDIAFLALAKVQAARSQKLTGGTSSESSEASRLHGLLLSGFVRHVYRVPDATAVYFTDAKGVRYRVYDTHFGPPLSAPFRRRRLVLCDQRAKSRVFVAADPSETHLREYTFAPNDDRAITPNRLAVQFSSAKFFPKHYQPTRSEREAARVSNRSGFR